MSDIDARKAMIRAFEKMKKYKSNGVNVDLKVFLMQDSYETYICAENEEQASLFLKEIDRQFLILLDNPNYVLETDDYFSAQEEVDLNEKVYCDLDMTFGDVIKGLSHDKIPVVLKSEYWLGLVEYDFDNQHFANQLKDESYRKRNYFYDYLGQPKGSTNKS